MAPVKCLSIIIADHNNSSHGQVGCYWSNFYFEVAKQSMSVCYSMLAMLEHIIQIMCAVGGLRNKLHVNKVFIFILHRNRYTHLKVSS